MHVPSLLQVLVLDDVLGEGHEQPARIHHAARDADAAAGERHELDVVGERLELRRVWAPGRTRCGRGLTTRRGTRRVEIY